MWNAFKCSNCVRMGQKGIISSLIATSAMSLLGTWWYSRKIEVTPIRMSVAEVWGEVSALLSLGAAVMFSFLIIKCTTYLVIVLVTRQIGLEGVGLYQAARFLIFLYVGFIIDSMEETICRGCPLSLTTMWRATSLSISNSKSLFSLLYRESLPHFFFCTADSSCLLLERIHSCI